MVLDLFVLLLATMAIVIGVRGTYAQVGQLFHNPNNVQPITGPNGVTGAGGNFG